MFLSSRVRAARTYYSEWAPVALRRAANKPPRRDSSHSFKMEGAAANTGGAETAARTTHEPAGGEPFVLVQGHPAAFAKAVPLREGATGAHLRANVAAAFGMAAIDDQWLDLRIASMVPRDAVAFEELFDDPARSIPSDLRFPTPEVGFVTGCYIVVKNTAPIASPPPHSPPYPAAW